MLTVLKDGEYQALGEEELLAFAREYPEIAKFWESPEEHLPELCLPKESSIHFDSWDQVAKRLLSQLWRLNNARIFHEPVDPEKLSIPDYHEVVKNPIDFGTIKQRLNTNHYHSLQEFIDDM